MSKLKNRLIRKLQDLKIKISVLSKSHTFSENIMRGVYKNYINHDKVIGWVDGCPVFSTLSPPALSKVQANMEAKNLIGLMQNRKHPNMANIGVTDKCNFNCIHCSFETMRSKKKILSTDELKKVILEVQRLGVSTIIFTGGEPLMREDLPELIKSVNKELSTTVLFTNGWFLEENVKKLKEAGLNCINVSLDSCIPEKHDKLRKKKGSFYKVIKGINAAKKEGFIVGISTCISEEQLKNGEVDNIIKLGKRLKVNEVLIFDNIPTGRLINRTDLVKDKSWTEDLIDLSEKYNSKSDYPGIYVYPYIKSYRGLGCSGGVTFFYISPYGNVHTCDFNPLVIGNVLETPLHLIWEKMSTLGYNCSSLKGCKMKDPIHRKKVLKTLKNKKE